MIRVESLHKAYGQVQALRGVDFRVEKGETFGIIGPNGAGKTTILKILLGLVRPDQGAITVDGLSLDQDPVGVRRRIGYVPQKDGFDERSTGREALSFLARLRRVEENRLEEYAREVGVDDLLERPVGTLSGGQRQKLSLAAALLGDPPVLLLDEPTASLDPRATASFRKLIERLAAEGRTIVLCSHLLSDVERLCHRVLILLDGRVEGVEPKQASGPGELFVDIDNTAEARDLLKSLGMESSWMNGSGLLVRMSATDQVRLLTLLAKAGIPIRSFETRRPSLEERFLETVRPETDANDD